MGAVETGEKEMVAAAAALFTGCRIAADNYRGRLSDSQDYGNCRRIVCRFCHSGTVEKPKLLQYGN